MAQTKTLSQLVLKEYYRSLTDPDAFEWVYFGHLTDFFETISLDAAKPTNLGIWISPLDVAALMDSCSEVISEDNKGYNHLRVAFTIAVLARSKELGRVAASVPEWRDDLDESDAMVYARAAEILGVFSPKFLPSLRETVEFGNKQRLNTLTAQEDSFISQHLASAGGLLLRHGTDEDRDEIARVIDEASPIAGYPLLYQYCTAGFDVDDEFVADQFAELQEIAFPERTDPNISLFCELAVRAGVPINFEKLAGRFEEEWIEGILHRMLRDPKRFENQKEALHGILPEIYDYPDLGALGGVVFARLGGTVEALEEIYGNPERWDLPAAAYLATVDDHTPEYFTELAASETDPDSILVLRFLGSQCSPRTPQLDLALVHLALRQPKLGEILLYDPRLRAPRDTFIGLFQSAVAGEEVSDADCALLLAIAERLGQPEKEQIIGGVVSFENNHFKISDRVGGALVRAVIDYGGTQTRALLLHRLLLWGSNKTTRDTLLVLISYLDGPESWIEPILRRFYGIDQEESDPWLEGDEALLIEGLHNVPGTGIEEMVPAMSGAELSRRPGLISHMWEAPHSTLWMVAWRVASSYPGLHPLLSPHGTKGSAPPSPVVIASRFLLGEDAGSLQRSNEEFLEEAVEPVTGWPAQLQALFEAETSALVRLPADGLDVERLRRSSKGETLSHSWILSVMSVDQPGSKLDDQALLKPERLNEDDNPEVYESIVDGWALEYRVSHDWRDLVGRGAVASTLIMTYGPMEYIFHIDESSRVIRKHFFSSSFEIKEGENLKLLREFYEDSVGAVLYKDGLTVYTNENSFLEAGVEHFGNAGDITGLNAFYDQFDKPNPFFFKGWIVWGKIVQDPDDTGDDNCFRWYPNVEMNELIEDEETERIIERFREFTVGEYMDIKRKFVLKDEEQIRENFRRWGIECGQII